MLTNTEIQAIRCGCFMKFPSTFATNVLGNSPEHTRSGENPYFPACFIQWIPLRKRYTPTIKAITTVKMDKSPDPRSVTPEVIRATALDVLIYYLPECFNHASPLRKRNTATTRPTTTPKIIKRPAPRFPIAVVITPDATVYDPIALQVKLINYTLPRPTHNNSRPRVTPTSVPTITSA